jgi:Mn-dependent DtxR family transcriptional regulator
MEEVAQKTARQGLAETLLRLPPEGGIINFDSVAKAMGVSPSLLSRYLGHLREAGVIRTKKTLALGLSVKVMNRRALERVAEGGRR